MLTELKLRHFRCFEALRVDCEAGFNFFIGRNGQGKTSILEAACVLLRLQSQRSATLAPLVRLGHKGFAVAGRWQGHALEFAYRTLRRKLRFDEAEQASTGEYLRLARVVSLANTDIELIRGGAEGRRRFLDFLGTQIEPGYRTTLRAYERALRARNALLKSATPRPRELAAYDLPLLEQGDKLSRMRARLTSSLAPGAAVAHAGISAEQETLQLTFAPGNAEDFAADLARTQGQEARLRQTVVGPHRDDLRLEVNGLAAEKFASEGQQRTLALALKLAQAQVFAAEEGAPPLLLIDDIFGELDAGRRNRLLAALPAASQKLVTATSLDWQENAIDGAVFDVAEAQVRRR